MVHWFTCGCAFVQFKRNFVSGYQLFTRCLHSQWQMISTKVKYRTFTLNAFPFDGKMNETRTRKGAKATGTRLLSHTQKWSHIYIVFVSQQGPFACTQKRTSGPLHKAEIPVSLLNRQKPFFQWYHCPSFFMHKSKGAPTISQHTVAAARFICLLSVKFVATEECLPFFVFYL